MMTTPSADNGPDFRLEQQIQHLLVAVELELRKAPEGVDELALIKALQRPPWELIGDVRFHEPEHLFPVHFLLFHVLYRLRDQLARDGERLDISPLRIRLRDNPTVAGTDLPDQADPLRAFYLDLSQYRLPEDAIRKMMDDFWAGRYRQPPPQEEVLTAANELGFSELPETFPEVKRRFRRAVMQAHPDRGGDTEAVQNLNHAFSILKAHFQHTL